MFQENFIEVLQSIKQKSSDKLAEIKKQLFKNKSNNTTVVINIEEASTSAEFKNQNTEPLAQFIDSVFTNKPDNATFVYNIQTHQLSNCQRKGTKIIEIEDDRQWFKEQYAKKIGTPLRDDKNINIILKKLYLKRKRLKETKTYSEPVNPKKCPRLLYWPDLPFIKKCLCKSKGNDCICTGCKLGPREPIPHATKKNKLPAGTLVGSLEATLSEAVDSYKIMIEDDTMDLKCTEFCGARCMSFKYTDAIPENESQKSMKLEEYSHILKQHRIERQIKFEEEHANDFEIKEPVKKIVKKRGPKTKVQIHVVSGIELTDLENKNNTELENEEKNIEDIETIEEVKIDAN